MPKYKPTYQDMWSETEKCFICGFPVLHKNDEICENWMCKEQMKIFKDDLEQIPFDWVYDTE